MSLYVREPGTAPARMGVYPKRRRQESPPTIPALAAEPVVRFDEPCYADFPREPERATSVA